MLLKRKRSISEQKERRINYSSERNAKRHIKAESYFFIVSRGLLTPPLLPTPLFQIMSNPSLSLSPPTSSHTVLSVVLFLWMNGWSCHIWCVVLWFLITNTNTHSKFRGQRLTHPYKYILTPPAICSQQLFALYWTNNSLTSKIYFPQYLFFSKITHL